MINLPQFFSVFKIICLKNKIENNSTWEGEKVRCCCISALVLNCFRLKKGRATFFDPKQLLRVSCILWCYYRKCYSISIKTGFSLLLTFNWNLTIVSKERDKLIKELRFGFPQPSTVCVLYALHAHICHNNVQMNHVSYVIREKLRYISANNSEETT